MKTATTILTGLTQSVIGLLVVLGKLPLVALAWTNVIFGTLAVVFLMLAGLGYIVTRGE